MVRRRRAEVEPGKTVAVVGDGPVGLLGVLAANRLGALFFSHTPARRTRPRPTVLPEHIERGEGAGLLRAARRQDHRARRFVPVVRTFAPVVAGVGKMHYRTFVLYNMVGALLWAFGLTTLGYFLGQIDVVKNNIELAIVAIIAASLVPVAIEFLKRRHETPERPSDLVTSDRD